MDIYLVCKINDVINFFYYDNIYTYIFGIDTKTDKICGFVNKSSKQSDSKEIIKKYIYNNIKILEYISTKKLKLPRNTSLIILDQPRDDSYDRDDSRNEDESYDDLYDLYNLCEDVKSDESDSDTRDKNKRHGLHGPHGLRGRHKKRKSDKVPKYTMLNYKKDVYDILLDARKYSIYDGISSKKLKINDITFNPNYYEDRSSLAYYFIDNEQVSDDDDTDYKSRLNLSHLLYIKYPMIIKHLISEAFLYGQEKLISSIDNIDEFIKQTFPIEDKYKKQVDTIFVDPNKPYIVTQLNKIKLILSKTYDKYLNNGDIDRLVAHTSHIPKYKHYYLFFKHISKNTYITYFNNKLYKYDNGSHEVIDNLGDSLSPITPSFL